MSGGPYDFENLYKTILKARPDNENRKRHLAIKIALEIRMNELAKAKRSIASLREITQKDGALINFLTALIYFIEGDMEKSEVFVDRCLDLNSNFLIAVTVKMRILFMDRKRAKNQNLFDQILKKYQSNAKILSDYFISSQRNNANLSEQIDIFNDGMRMNECSLSANSFTKLSWTSSGFKFHERAYKNACTGALTQIEKIFSLKIAKDFSPMQHAVSIEDIIPAIGVESSRAIPHIQDFPNFNNKGLQMLCSPGYWTKSQNQLLCFILSEIQTLRRNNKIKKVNLHEIGPGCGYLMWVLSGIEDISISGSDCYNHKSFDIKEIKKMDMSFSETIDNKPLEYFCYYLINKLTGMLKKIINHPVKLNSFPIELIEADIVYSHLPVIDQYDGNWVAEDWNNFFKNIFYSSHSSVKSVIIAANNHSEALRDFCSIISKKELDSIDAKIIRGNICNGTLIIARRKSYLKV